MNKQGNSFYEEIEIGLVHQSDIVKARQTGRKIASDLGFSMADQTRLATAISELTRNAVVYAGKGVCKITTKKEGIEKIIVVNVMDEGPGIPDIDQALTDRFSSGKSMGMGLPGTKRLVDSLAIQSVPGKTCVTIEMTRFIK